MEGKKEKEKETEKERKGDKRKEEKRKCGPYSQKEILKHPTELAKTLILLPHWLASLWQDRLWHIASGDVSWYIQSERECGPCIKTYN